MKKTVVKTTSRPEVYMNRNDKIAEQLQAAGISVFDPRLRIREGNSGAHTIPAHYEQVFDKEIDSIRVRAFFPSQGATATRPTRGIPRFFGRALEILDYRKRKPRALQTPKPM